MRWAVNFAVAAFFFALGPLNGSFKSPPAGVLEHEEPLRPLFLESKVTFIRLSSRRSWWFRSLRLLPKIATTNSCDLVLKKRLTPHPCSRKGT